MVVSLCVGQVVFYEDRNFQGRFPRVQQRLCRHVFLPEQVSLLQGGERLLHGLRPHQLHGQPVLPEEGRVLRLPEHDGNERLHQVLPYDPHGNHTTNHSPVLPSPSSLTQPITAQCWHLLHHYTTNHSPVLISPSSLTQPITAQCWHLLHHYTTNHSPVLTSPSSLHNQSQPSADISFITYTTNHSPVLTFIYQYIWPIRVQSHIMHSSL